MSKKNFVKIFFSLVFILILILLINSNFLKKSKKLEIEEENINTASNSNIIKGVEYTTKDKDGNEYFVRAAEGEIDFSDPNIIFLTKVYALIKLIDSNEITIISDYGKYNSENYDTIFSKNVVINYLNNKITGEYLDFSLERNSIIISKNVIYYNLQNVLKADVVEVDTKTKDVKIFMHEQEKKVNIKNKN